MIITPLHVAGGIAGAVVMFATAEGLLGDNPDPPPSTPKILAVLGGEAATGMAIAGVGMLLGGSHGSGRGVARALFGFGAGLTVTPALVSLGLLKRIGQ